MSSDPSKFLFSILFFFAVAFCSSIKTCVAGQAQTVNNEAYTSQAGQASHTELETLHRPTLPVGQTAVQKYSVFSDLLAVAFFCQSGMAAESSFIKASSLLVKDYLSHIYPYHNFW